MEEEDVADDDVKLEDDDHVEEEEDDDVEDDYDVEEDDRSQDLGPHFERSCAVECTSTYHKSHFTCKCYRKNSAAQNLGLHFVRACAVETHANRKFTRKVPEPRT